jgi:AcrR family transcriptional regulator
MQGAPYTRGMTEAALPRIPESRPRLVETAAQQRREAVARAIEDAALDLFAERRMSDVTVEEIAVHAGVAVRTLYRYFPTKEHLFAGMPRRQAEQMAELMRARPAEETPFEALRNATTELGIDSVELTRWMHALANCDAKDRIVLMAHVVSTNTMIEAMAERSGLPAGDLWPAMAGNIASSALIVGAKQWFADGGDLEAHLLAALDVAGDGLAGVPTAR